MLTTLVLEPGSYAIKDPWDMLKSQWGSFCDLVPYEPISHIDFGISEVVIINNLTPFKVEINGSVVISESGLLAIFKETKDVLIASEEKIEVYRDWDVFKINGVSYEIKPIEGEYEEIDIDLPD